MILQSIRDSALFGHLISREDGMHLQQTMQSYSDKHQQMMISYIECSYNNLQKMNRTAQGCFDDEHVDNPYEMEYSSLSFMLEMMGGAFAFCGTSAGGKKQIHMKQAFEVYQHMSRSIMFHFRQNQLYTMKDDIQQLLRRMISHLSLTFTNLGQMDQPYILSNVLRYYHRLVTTSHMHLNNQTWAQLIVVLLGIAQHIVRDAKRKGEWIEQMKQQITQTIMLSFIFSRTQDQSLWKIFNLISTEWAEGNSLAKCLMQRWRVMMTGLTEGLMQTINSKRMSSDICIKFVFEEMKSKASNRSSIKQSDNNYLQPISPFIIESKSPINIFKSSEKPLSEDSSTSPYVSVQIMKDHLIYVWHKYLHIFQGSRSLYASERSPDYKIQSHFIKTIKQVVCAFLQHSEMKHQKSTTVKDYKRTLASTKSLNFLTMGPPTEIIYFDSLFSNKQDEHKFLQSLIGGQYFPQGNILLNMFGKFLYPNADFVSIIVYQKITIKALRSLANIFIDSFGEYKEDTLMGFYKLLTDNLRVSNSLKIVKIVVKILRSNLPYQNVLLESTALTLRNEYDQICKQLQISQGNSELRRQFNIIIVDFLCVYAGRGSELVASQTDSLFHIAIESFKAERVSVDVFHKLTVVLLHQVKMGKLYDTTKAILEISIKAAKKDPIKLVKYLKTAVSFIYMASVLIQGMIHQNMYYDPIWVQNMLNNILNRLQDFKILIAQKMKNDPNEQAKIQCQVFLNILLQTICQLCILVPSVLADKNVSRQIVDCTHDTFSSILDSKTVESVSYMLKSLTTLSGNQRLARYQFLYNTDLGTQLSAKYNFIINNQNSLFYCLNRNTIIECIQPLDISHYESPCNPRLFFIVRNCFGSNVWEANQYLRFLDKNPARIAPVTGEELPQEESKESIDDHDLEQIIEADLKNKAQKSKFSKVKTLIKENTAQPSDDLSNLSWTMFQHLGLASTYSKRQTLQVQCCGMKSLSNTEGLRGSIKKLDQMYFRDTIFVNSYYVDGIDDTALIKEDISSPDYQQFMQFFASMGVQLSDEDLKKNAYQHISQFKIKFQQSKHYPRFWLNSWFYSSTILTEVIYILNNLGVTDDLKCLPETLYQPTYFNGLIVLWVNIKDQDLHNPLLPLILKQFFEALKENREGRSNIFLIIYAYSTTCKHKSKFYRVLTLQISKTSNVCEFDPHIGSPLLNHMCLHEDELKLYLLSFVINCYRFQHPNQTDKLRKREKEILQITQKNWQKNEDVFELLTQQY